MKIAFIGTAYPFRGGLAMFNERICQEFQAQGHTVDVFTFTTQYPEILFPGKSQYSDDAAPASLTIQRTISSINPITWAATANKIIQGNYDLVVLKYWHPFMAMCFSQILKKIKKNSTTKVITIVDNIIPHENKIGYNWLTQKFVHTIDGFIVMSQSVAKDIQQFSTTKPIQYNPHPIYDTYGDALPKDTAKDYLKWDKNQKTALFFGFIRAYKGLDILIKAIPYIKTPNIKIVVAGEFYEDKTYYDTLIKELADSSTIELHADFISNEEVKYYFSAADVVVQPYKTATQSGISQIAYHFEKPMIVTNVGGLPEIVPHNKAGLVVEPNPVAIANAIDDFYTNNKENAFIEGVKQEKKRYQWDNFVQQLLQLYHTL